MGRGCNARSDMDAPLPPPGHLPGSRPNPSAPRARQLPCLPIVSPAPFQRPAACPAAHPGCRQPPVAPLTRLLPCAHSSGEIPHCINSIADPLDHDPSRHLPTMEGSGKRALAFRPKRVEFAALNRHFPFVSRLQTPDLVHSCLPLTRRRSPDHLRPPLADSCAGQNRPRR